MHPSMARVFVGYESVAVRFMEVIPEGPVRPVRSAAQSRAQETDAIISALGEQLSPTPEMQTALARARAAHVASAVPVEERPRVRRKIA